MFECKAEVFWLANPGIKVLASCNRPHDLSEVAVLSLHIRLVAIPIPSYFERPEVYTRHTHPLVYIQIHTSVCYYQYSFFPHDCGSMEQVTS